MNDQNVTVQLSKKSCREDPTNPSEIQNDKKITEKEANEDKEANTMYEYCTTVYQTKTFFNRNKQSRRNN